MKDMDGWREHASGFSLGYESAIVEALGLTTPAGEEPGAVQSAWTRLQEC